MKAVVTARSFQVEITKPDMVLILRAESGPSALETSLVTKLDDLGDVDQIEYDGHFGPFIFFRLPHPEPKGLRKRVTDTIKAHLKKCRVWDATPPKED